MRICCALTLIGNIACLTVSQSAEPNHAVKAIVAVVANSPQNHVPLAEFTLGTATVSESIDLEVELRNDTDADLQFDEVQTACDCTRVSPNSGTLKAKGKMPLKLRVTTAELPTGAVGAGVINFMLKKRPSFEARFTYGLSRYAGIPSRLIVLTIPRSSHELEFSVPLVTGEGVTAEDIAIEAAFDDVAAEVNGKIDIAAHSLTGTISFDPNKDLTMRWPTTGGLLI